jgi:UDP-N-acetylmuramoyl-tripeptide--D-alanyl-D-alanine ligase
LIVSITFWDFFMTIPFHYSVLLAVILWTVYFWLRTYHLIRYFQLEGYDSKRYINWFFKAAPERRTMVFSAVLLIAGLVALIVVAGKITDAAFVDTLVPVIGVISCIVAIVFIAIRPVDREIKQPFTRTQRAMRLLATAFLVVLVLQVLVLLAFGPLKIDLRGGRFVMAGAIGLFMAGLTATFIWAILPLADIINYPLEEAFRQYYLARARRYLKRSGATVIAITGSYGKTTTKHYLNHILEGRFRVLMTPKSYNTLLGISRVINDVLAKDVSYDYFIAETDAYFVGENARICRLVQPTIGMVMTVGPMHLERLGSMENITKAQYEVVEALPPTGAAFFNGDDPAVHEMAGRGYPQMTQFVTQKGINGSALEAINIQMTKEGLDFDVRDNATGEVRSMHAPLYGEHNITNILMAAAVAHYLGMSLTEIAMRVSTLQPAEHRLIRRVMPDGTILIDDSYSANPVGTQTALGVLGLHSDSPRRVVISAGMFELGEASDRENRKLGESIAKVATDVILIGAKQTEPVKAGLESAKFPSDRVYIVSGFNEAVDIYKGILHPGDALLMLTDLPDTYA